MDIATYQHKALETAIYPHQGANLVYPALGLCGEAGEVLGKVLELAEERQIRAEVGDVLWYTAVLAREAQLDLAQVSGQWPASSSGSLLDAACALSSAAAVCAELVKKCVRDDDSVLSAERREKLRTALREVLHAASACVPAGLALAAAENVEKLSGRAERGVLNGDGDLR